MKIYIDDVLVTEKDYMSRVRIEDDFGNEDDDYEDFLDMFLSLVADDEFESTPIENIIEDISLTYLGLLNFYDTESIDRYIC